jgi:plastocyanin
MTTGRRMASAVLALAGAATLVAGCSSGSGSAVKQSPGDSVQIKTFAFSPKTITVARGSTVTWTNRDEILHTVTSDATPRPFDGELDGRGKTFAHRFDRAGRFAYHCERHPGMHGTVVVTR